jgi:hypothetical protein
MSNPPVVALIGWGAGTEALPLQLLVREYYQLDLVTPGNKPW